MTREEHKQRIQSLFGMIAPDHQAAASEILTGLTNDYEETLTNYETATANVQQLTTNNETLRDVNAKLFLQVGSVPKTDPNPPADNGGGSENKLTFENLFNEKGELL